VCVVGRSYLPGFYEFIENPRLRQLFQQIAAETEEDYQNIIQTLEKFNVTVIRPNIPMFDVENYLSSDRRIPAPISMTPRDQMIMIGEKFFVFPYDRISVKASGRNIPSTENINSYIDQVKRVDWWSPITNHVKAQGNQIIDNSYHDVLNLIPSNGITRIGKDLYFGYSGHNENHPRYKQLEQEFFSNYRCHNVKTDGHMDGCFTPIKPGFIISIHDITNYEKTFPGWEVVYLEGEHWSKMKEFTDLKLKNQGRWWIKGREYDNELIDYVETWLYDWTGYVEESVFDVNILVIDEKNIIVNGYNEKAFEAFSRHGVTPHICPMRHRYFWDGGVHCATLDLHREGTMQDYFKERG
jgi:N-dimethylarginine dimethylaminohydrolase